VFGAISGRNDKCPDGRGNDSSGLPINLLHQETDVDNRTSPDPHDDNRGTGSELQIFDNGEFSLEIIPVGDSFIARASGLARALGMRDAYRLVDTLPDDEKGYTLSCTPGGDQEIWHVTEPGLYRAIGQRQAARIKNEEVKKQVVRFQRWFYHDVLPSIRKTGSYTLPGAQVAIPSHPETLRKWAAEIEAREAAEMRAAIERAGREAAEEENAIMAPKAAQADHHRAADGHMTVGDLANKLKAWAKDECNVRVYHDDVWEFCRELGLLMKSKDTVRKNRVKAFALENGYMREKDSEHTGKDGKVHTNHTPRITPKGEGYIWDRATTRIANSGTLKRQPKEIQP
jgi:anti-repressor protein